MTLVFVPQAVLLAVVPMRVERRMARVCVVVSSGVEGIVPIVAVMSCAVAALAVSVLMQRVSPELRTSPLKSTSASRST